MPWESRSCSRWSVWKLCGVQMPWPLCWGLSQQSCEHPRDPKRPFQNAMLQRAAWGISSNKAQSGGLCGCIRCMLGMRRLTDINMHLSMLHAGMCHILLRTLQRFIAQQVTCRRCAQ